MPEKPTKKVRLNMRIPAQLLRWAKSHAKANNKSLTQLIVDYLTGLWNQTRSNRA